MSKWVLSTREKSPKVLKFENFDLQSDLKEDSYSHIQDGLGQKRKERILKNFDKFNRQSRIEVRTTNNWTAKPRTIEQKPTFGNRSDQEMHLDQHSDYDKSITEFKKLVTNSVRKLHSWDKKDVIRKEQLINPLKILVTPKKKFLRKDLIKVSVMNTNKSQQTNVAKKNWESIHLVSKWQKFPKKKKKCQNNFMRTRRINNLYYTALRKKVKQSFGTQQNSRDQSVEPFPYHVSAITNRTRPCVYPSEKRDKFTKFLVQMLGSTPNKQEKKTSKNIPSSDVRKCISINRISNIIPKTPEVRQLQGKKTVSKTKTNVEFPKHALNIKDSLNVTNENVTRANLYHPKITLPKPQALRQSQNAKQKVEVIAWQKEQKDDDSIITFE
ncbi:unnamed protein product [Moneuplotes crassus]|uniref:Uncharacterized protein n=1 Tax=Euplotes crassus TaxID=5936 RepID=A0AAD1ULZ7_EUPCR|nr:unnamed protein product [Moneuplotes crassus]